MAVLVQERRVEGHESPPDGFAALCDCEQTAARLAGTTWAGRPGATLGDALLRVTRVERQIAATKVAIVGAFDASQQYRLDHQPSVGTWLAARAKADPKRVNHQRFVARRLRSMPLTERAFERGVIGFEHAAVLARANAPTVMTAFAEAEGELVAAAREMDFDEFCVVVDRWLDFVLPERAEKRAREQEERRSASASRTWEGMVRVDAWLDAIGGTEFLAELHRLEKEMFEADWAEARARCGDGATAGDLRRTSVQRRADAMVEMARRSATCDRPGQPPKWVLNIMMGVRTFFAEADAAAAEREAEGHRDGGTCRDTDEAAGDHAATSGPDPAAAGGNCTCHNGGEPTKPEPAADGAGAAPSGNDCRLAGDPASGATPETESATDGSHPSPAARGPAPDTDRSDVAVVPASARRDHDRPAEPYAGPPPARSRTRRPLPDWWGAPDPFGPDFEALRPDTMCELEDGTAIAPSQALSLGLAAMWRRVIFGPGSHILDFGQERDYFTGPLREAIIIRDRWCKDPGCRVPGRDCHIDHLVPRSRGGPTSEANGRCQCSTGNHLKGAMPPDEWMRDGPDPEPAAADDDDP